MTKVPGAAAELDRAVAWLAEEVRAVVAALTGGPAPEVRIPSQPSISSWDDPLPFVYNLHVQGVTLSPSPDADQIEAGRSHLTAAGWTAQTSPAWADKPVNLNARKGEFSMTLIIPEARDVLAVSARTPTIALHEPRRANPTADCPSCDRALTEVGTPKRRHELWWGCGSCGWLGWQWHEGEELHPMRHLQGDEADCFFCGWEESNVASPPLEKDGQLEDWLVCLACGRSNPRRYPADRG